MLVKYEKIQEIKSLYAVKRKGFQIISEHILLQNCGGNDILENWQRGKG